MTLKAQMAADADLFTNPDDFGEQVTYLPKGDEVGFAVNIQFQQGAVMVGGRLLAIETEGMAMIPKKDVAVPKSGDRFRREDGEIWDIDLASVRSSDPVFWRLAVNKDPLPTFRGF